LLLIAYAKSEKDDLSAQERNAIHRLIRKVMQEFATGRIK
jgi:RNase P protein component